MEEQLSPSVPASEIFPQVQPSMPTISPEMVEQMKLRARQEAIRITMEQRQVPFTPNAKAPNPFPQQQQVVYLRRNLTIAELIVTLILACGIVSGIQVGWNFATNVLPRIEVKMK